MVQNRVRGKEFGYGKKADASWRKRDKRRIPYLGEGGVKRGKDKFQKTRL